MLRLNNLSPDRRGEVLGLGIITFGLIVFLSLISYHAADFERSDGRFDNWIGLPGAWIARLGFGALGWIVFLIPLLLLHWGVRRFRLQKFSSSLLPISGTLILIFSFCTLLAIWFFPDSERMIQGGGIVGSYAAQRMMVFGPVGSYLILLAMAAIALLLSTEVLFTPILSKLAENLRTRWQNRKARRRAILTNLEKLPPEPSRRQKKGKPPEEDLAITIEPKPARRQKKGKPPEEDLAITVESEAVPDEVEVEDDEDFFPEILTAQDRPGARKKHKPAPAPRELENYQLPPLSLFNKPKNGGESISREEILHNSETLERTLSEFGIEARVVEVNHGPVITRYELEPPPGVKISRFTGLADNLALELRASHVRIVAPIPGKAAVGVEIPNRNRSEVLIRDIFSSDSYLGSNSLLKLAMGKTISGEAFVADLASMPHLLIAGATGSGKSVCVNTLIASILVNASPDEVKFLMIDPKRVELKMYSDIPHMIAPVVTEPKRAAAALRWIVEEMEDRYRHLSRARVRDVDEFNRKQREMLTRRVEEADPSLPSQLPYIVVIIDELADLMMVARGEIEGAVCRLAQMARAVGIHLVLATQRPSVNIITGVIKANFPTRIAFQVSSKVDSRTILDCNGAECLLGKGDMLFSHGGASKPIRVQGSLITTREIEALTDFIKEQKQVEYLEEKFEEEEEAGGLNEDGLSGDDTLYNEALELVLAAGQASTSLLQRRLKIGYGRAARLLDEMEQQGVVGPPRGSKPREVIAER